MNWVMIGGYPSQPYLVNNAPHMEQDRVGQAKDMGEGNTINSIYLQCVYR